MENEHLYVRMTIVNTFELHMQSFQFICYQRWALLPMDETLNDR